MSERTCDRCARGTTDWQVIDECYICADCRAEIAVEEAEVERLTERLDRLDAAVEALDVCKAHHETTINKAREQRDDARQQLARAVAALEGIVQAAIKCGVNDQVAEAIAHAEVVMGTRHRGGQ